MILVSALSPNPSFFFGSGTLGLRIFMIFHTTFICNSFLRASRTPQTSITIFGGTPYMYN